MRPRMIRLLLVSISLSVLAGLSACGGNRALTCDDPQRYQQAIENERLKAPEDLDAPEPYLEMPVPRANPRPERPEGSPCLDLPPRIPS